ncbi:UDP-2,3-diacylglucosamine diphosphatase LpxI [uncultured Roseobacter sp.]|uniref:LpxI family protein n=1 Tax=uncultured Roseobacter sp. TaxID=114847 RepID=UPI00262A6E44|nr:UDP-2,3-diacylglucosamine diphosphatase LpxI [uncultured Roseobacter sp.]
MLALVCGRGGLPERVAAALPEMPLICVLEGFAPERLAADLVFRLEHLGSFLETLKARGVRQVCFCGAIERPAVDPAMIDAATLPLVPQMMAAMAGGDDAALRAVMGIFEDKGFEIVAAHGLAPDLLVEEGVLSTAQPDAQMRADLVRGRTLLAALAPLDVGQGCVVGCGLIWGIESIGGTDHMLATLPAGVAQARALLIKSAKAGQDRRVDLPTIGPDTLRAVAEAGLAGLVIEAGSVIVLDRQAVVAAADAAGLVLWAEG